MRVGPLAVAVALLVGLAPGVQASLDSLLPPENLQARYEDGALVLSWQPPSSDATTAYTYNVYRNAALIATTADTWILDQAASGVSVYQVVAIDAEGQSSAPSEPLLVQQQSTESLTKIIGDPTRVGIDMEPSCGFLLITTYEEWPYASVGIVPYCIPVIGDLTSGSDILPVKADLEFG